MKQPEVGDWVKWINRQGCIEISEVTVADATTVYIECGYEITGRILEVRPPTKEGA